MSSPKDVVRAEYWTPEKLHSDEGMPDPEVKLQAKLKSNKKPKKDVFVDPEVVRKRREEKAAAKWKAAQAEEEAKARGDIPPEKLRFKTREFVKIPTEIAEQANGHASRQTVSIMTWNLLAQGLVRRTLFPGSDLLKWKDRGPILTQEFKHYSPTVACMQEVDRIEYHGPNMQDLGYDFVYQKGYQAKLHGLCIAWKADIFEKAAEKAVKLDDATFDSQENGTTGMGDVKIRRTAGSRVTRNLGLFVALRFKQEREAGRPQGIIFVTHHLFWHPRHQYERTRQVAVLLREIDKFRKETDDGAYASWPCFFAGDFNIQPTEGTYRLMTGAELSEAQKETLQLSAVVHKSLDEHNFKLAEAERLGQQELLDDEDVAEDEDDDKDDGGKTVTGEVYAQPEGDEDRVLKNTRPARETDGLLSLEEIQGVYRQYTNGLWSVYGRHYGSVAEESGNWFGERDTPNKEKIDEDTRLQRIREGYYEPAWTSVTPLWRCTLDYIFCIPPQKTSQGDKLFEIKRLLKTHRLADVEPGLPRFDKEPSDHMALIAEIEI